MESSGVVESSDFCSYEWPGLNVVSTGLEKIVRPIIRFYCITALDCHSNIHVLISQCNHWFPQMSECYVAYLCYMGF